MGILLSSSLGIRLPRDQSFLYRRLEFIYELHPLCLAPSPYNIETPFSEADIASGREHGSILNLNRFPNRR